MKFLFVTAVVVCCFILSVLAETTKPLRLEITPEIAPGVSGIKEKYLPRTSSCSENRNDAKSYASEEWNQLSDVDKAKYLMEVYYQLNKRHGYDYSYRILTCKAYRESGFDTQIDTGIKGSSARGISQVVESTAIYLLKPRSDGGFGFKSKLRGFEDLDGSTAYKEMCSSMLLQMELGLGVMHMKSMENDTGNAFKIMASYYGHASFHCCNELFGRAVYNCADCIKRNSDQPTQECLDKAKYPFIQDDIKDKKGNILQVGNCESLSLKSGVKEWACYEPDGLR